MIAKLLDKVDELSIKQNWFDRGFSFGVWKDPPGQIWADYVHEVDELFMLAEGKAELIIGKQQFLPQIGEEILIPAHVSHTVKNTGNTTNRWYYGYKIKK